MILSCDDVILIWFFALVIKIFYFIINNDINRVALKFRCLLHIIKLIVGIWYHIHVIVTSQQLQCCDVVILVSKCLLRNEYQLYNSTVYFLNCGTNSYEQKKKTSKSSQKSKKKVLKIVLYLFSHSLATLSVTLLLLFCYF